MDFRKIIPVVLLLAFQLLNTPVLCQDTPHPVSNYGVYEFLDELASLKIISINSSIKPYSRSYIAAKLAEADTERELLNQREQKELDFYLLDFGKELNEERRNGITAQGHNGVMAQGYNGIRAQWIKGVKVGKRLDLFYYKDSLYSLTVIPIAGGELFSNSSGSATYWRNGLEARAYIGKWGFFASLRDNHEKPLLGLPEYLTSREGGHIKNSTDWSEMQGGVTFSWKWGNAGLVKDRMQWGNNYKGSNIFSGNNPTFIQLRLQLNPAKWFSFNYVHGWLNSMVVDSNRSYYVTNSYGTSYREVYHRKYMAANMFTFTPVKDLNLSAGNSIIYSDIGFSPSYLVPLFFYKSVDHSVNSGIGNMNSQMFFDISSRQIKNTHLYLVLFVDELSVSRIFKQDQWNFVSWKTGFRVYNLPITNLSVTAEYTYTYPLAFQHFVPTLTFESNNYNLGHYLKDNSREWYLAIDYRPLRTLKINLFFIDAIRGPDYTELGTPRVGNPPLASVEWHNRSAGLKASYQLINDFYSWLSFTSSRISGDPRWSPDYFGGRKNTINCGITIAF